MRQQQRERRHAERSGAERDCSCRTIHRNQQLERELRRKDKAQAETAALLVLRKKLNDYWGIDNEDS